jgi:hypothetical protein
MPDCSLSVPEDEASIQAAIDRAPSPGVVCIGEGYYEETLTLRDGVSVRGSGEKTEICGELRAPASSIGASIERLSLGRTLKLASPLRLSIVELVRREELTGCGRPNGPAIDVDLSAGGTIDLDVERSVLEPSGIAFGEGTRPGEPLDLTLAIRNCRCAGSGCYDFLNFSAELPSGSRARILLENNLLARVALQAIGGSVVLAPEDRAESELLLVHNTIFAWDEANAAIYFWGESSLPIRARANAIASFRSPFLFGSQLGDPNEYDLGGNVVGLGTDGPETERWYDAWFVDANGGDFHPAPGSPLIDAAGPNDTGTDPDGVPRAGGSDAGAYQATR